MANKTTNKPPKTPFLKTARKHWMLLLMLAPAVIYVLVFSYIPMTGIVLAFKNYQYSGGIYGSPWNGLSNFKALLTAGKLWQVTRNTFLYNVAFIFLGVIFEMGSAILLNELLSKVFKKITQSLMFLPYFISWVVAGAIMYNIFNYERGVFNHILNAFGAGSFDLYNTPGAWPFVIIFLKLWKQTGYGSIVYLAAITGLDQEMFEAASIDGAENTLPHNPLACPDNDDFSFNGDWKYFQGRFRAFLSDSKKQRAAGAFDERNRHVCIQAADRQRQYRGFCRGRTLSVGTVLYND